MEMQRNGKPHPFPYGKGDCDVVYSTLIASTNILALA